MKTYETYKDSGIEWLGQIPGHWDFGRTKNVVSLVNDRVIGSSLRKVGLENLESNTGKFIETGTDFEGEGILFQKDDILFGKLRPYLAKVYKAEFEGQSVGDIYVFRAKMHHSADFLKYVFISDFFISIVDGSTYGAKMPRANWDFISNVKIPIPPISEQEVIASYLDYKIGQVDLLIAEKEKQMKDLQQYRMSLISETVTHGLNPDVKMKESGVEWLGRIPEHWTISKLARKYSGIGSGITPSTDNFDYYSEEGYNWLQTGDLSDGIISSTSKKITPKALQDYKLRIYPLNSIVVAMYGATIAKLGFLNIETTTNQACCVIPPTEEMDSKFSFYSLYASKQSLINKSSGGGQPNISQHIIRNHIIPVPPLSEQQAIASFLDEKTARIDSTLKELETQIADLRCYKTSVITEAVTGKVDVRQWKQT